MSADEAVRDLLAVSTDIRRVEVIDDSGAVVAGASAAAAAELVEAADRLWRAAADVAHARRAGAGVGDAATAGEAETAGATPDLEHVAVDLGDGAVIVVAAGARRIVAATEADPVLSLALFDLRTCLSDAFADADPVVAAPGEAPDAAEGPV